MIALGIPGAVTRDFAQIWRPVPEGLPAREARGPILTAGGCVVADSYRAMPWFAVGKR